MTDTTPDKVVMLQITDMKKYNDMHYDICGYSNSQVSVNQYYVKNISDKKKIKNDTHQ